MATFALDPRLAADTLAIGDLELCRVVLMNDARYPWLILVPRRPDLREIVDLGVGERAVLIEEIAEASRVLGELTGAEKLNIGAIGNLVSQLHVHVVARFAVDAAWPAPVWGRGTASRYAPEAARDFVARIAERLPLHLVDQDR